MQKLFDKFADVRVLIVGDVMLDQYWWGSVERISPEAPVPVVNLKRKTLVPGGAANVAANVAGLGAEAYLVGITGTDQEGENLPKILAEMNISGEFLIKNTDRTTTVKTRIIAQNQQIARIDQEEICSLSIDTEEIIMEKIASLMDKTDAVIISDYAKGMISENIAMRLITIAKSADKIVIVDPKGENYKKYENATILTPNKKEIYEATGLDTESSESLEEAGSFLLESLKLEGLLITRGEKGMTLFQKGRKSRNLHASARKVYDVTGAGDTVIATLAVAVAAGENFYEAAHLANTAAGLVVERVGTTAINIGDLKNVLAE